MFLSTHINPEIYVIRVLTYVNIKKESDKGLVTNVSN